MRPPLTIAELGILPSAKEISALLTRLISQGDNDLILTAQRLAWQAQSFSKEPFGVVLDPVGRIVKISENIPALMEFIESDNRVGYEIHSFATFKEYWDRMKQMKKPVTT